MRHRLAPPVADALGTRPLYFVHQSPTWPCGHRWHVGVTVRCPSKAPLHHEPRPCHCPLRSAPASSSQGQDCGRGWDAHRPADTKQAGPGVGIATRPGVGIATRPETAPQPLAGRRLVAEPDNLEGRTRGSDLATPGSRRADVDRGQLLASSRVLVPWPLIRGFADREPVSAESRLPVISASRALPVPGSHRGLAQGHPDNCSLSLGRRDSPPAAHMSAVPGAEQVPDGQSWALRTPHPLLVKWSEQQRPRSRVLSRQRSAHTGPPCSCGERAVPGRRAARWPARPLRGHSHKPGVPDLMALPATLDTVEPDPHPSGVPTVAWPESLGEGGRPLVCVVSPPRCSRGQSPPSRPSGNVAALLARAPSGPRLLAPAGAAGSPGLGSAGQGGWSQALEDGQ